MNPYVVQKIVRYKKNAVPRDTLIAQVTLHGRRAKFFMFSAKISNSTTTSCRVRENCRACDTDREDGIDANHNQ